jgi:hypothetical protein
MSSNMEYLPSNGEIQEQLSCPDEEYPMDGPSLDYLFDPTPPFDTQSISSDPAIYHNPTAHQPLSPMKDSFSLSDPFDHSTPSHCDGMNNLQIYDDIPMSDPAQDPFSQSSEIHYPYNNYSGQPLDHPDVHRGSLNDHGHPFPQPPQYTTGELPHTPINSIEFPPTPATNLPASKSNNQHLKTPSKSNKKPRKPMSSSQNKEKRKFLCTYPGCTRISTCQSNLDEHILTHTKVREYACEYVSEDRKACTASFGRPWGLHRHYESKHQMDVKVLKKNGARNRVETGSPKKIKREGGMGEQRPLPDGLPPSIDGSQGPYTPPPTVDRLNITTRGPEGPFICCGREYPDGNSFMVHHHFSHDIPNSSFCCCDSCQNAQLLFDPSWTEQRVPDGDMDIETEDENMNIDPTLRTPVTYNHTHIPISISSPTHSTSSMAENTSIYTPPETLPDAKIELDTEMDSFDDTVTHNAQDYPIHNHGPVSPTNFYDYMNMDYNDMTDEQFGDAFGNDWVKMD